MTAERPYRFGEMAADAVDALAADAGTAIRAVEAGKTMAEIGLTPERLRKMAQHEERLAEPPAIWPDMPYAEQQSRAQRLQEIEAFRLAKLWRVLAQDNDRVSQRVVIARGIEWKGELQDRVFIHKAAEPQIPKRLPVLLLDADHDPLIGAATLPTNRRTVIRPRLNAEVIQVRDTACSKNKLHELAGAPGRRHGPGPARGRPGPPGADRHLQARGRPAACRAGRPESISIAHFGAIRGLDGWKDFDTVIVAGREQPRPLDVENMARCLFGADPEPLLLTGEFVPQMRGHRMKDGTRTAVMVQVHPDLRVQAAASSRSASAKSSRWSGGCAWCTGPRPARVFLLSNLPTALPVDRLATWAEVMPEQDGAGHRRRPGRAAAVLCRAGAGAPQPVGHGRGGRALAGPKGSPGSI